MKSRNSKILYLTVLTLLFVGLMGLTSCKRSAPQDPTMQGPAGFRIILSGTANPSTIYIPESQPAVSSVITVTALNNDGTPVANSKVVFKVEKWGYLDNNQISDVRTTNSSGVASINYYIPARQNVGGDDFDYVEVTLVDDGRLDTAPSTLSHVRDRIPIRLIPYAKSTFRIHGHITTPDGNGIGEIPVTLLGGDGSGTVLAVTRPSGSYEFYVLSGWYGTITPSSTPYTFTPTRYEFVEAYPVIDNLDGIDFTGTLTIGDTLAVSPENWALGSDPGTRTFSVVNKTGDASISYIVLSSNDWITVSPSSGVTPGSFTAAVTLNDTISDRSGSIIVSSTDTQTSEAVVAVTQATSPSAPAILQVSPTSQNFSASGQVNFPITVSNGGSGDTEISYTVTTNDPTWITLSAATGTTTGGVSSFNITVAANSNSQSRTATLTVTAQGSDVESSPQTVTITQDGTSTGLPDLIVSRERFVVPAATTGALPTVTVTTNYGSTVNWYIQNFDTWLTVTPVLGSTADGDNTFVITIQTTNVTGSDRVGTIYVREENDITYTTIEVVQEAN